MVVTNMNYNETRKKAITEAKASFLWNIFVMSLQPLIIIIAGIVTNDVSMVLFGVPVFVGCLGISLAKSSRVYSDVFFKELYQQKEDR